MCINVRVVEKSFIVMKVRKILLKQNGFVNSDEVYSGQFSSVESGLNYASSQISGNLTIEFQHPDGSRIMDIAGSISIS